MIVTMSFLRMGKAFLLLLSCLAVMAVEKPDKDAARNAKLPACASCRTLTESFKKGLKSTSRGKFEGGDSEWEEEKMGSYKRSEVRLIEIQEQLCKDVERGKHQCEANAEEYEGLIEDWWGKEQDTEPDLHVWLCIERLNLCCPQNHYGPQCLPCSGGVEMETPCGGNGKCKGAGTRKGSGECACNPGYKGELCRDCSYGYYEAYKDDTKLICEKCHKACNGPCSGPGQKSCVACKEGWKMNTEVGCLDVNECAAPKDPCKVNEFCVNNEGSFTCLLCDKACEGCTGDGPDNCNKCADDYIIDKDKNMCVDEDTIEEVEEGSAEGNSEADNPAEESHSGALDTKDDEPSLENTPLNDEL